MRRYQVLGLVLACGTILMASDMVRRRVWERGPSKFVFHAFMQIVLIVVFLGLYLRQRRICDLVRRRGFDVGERQMSLMFSRHGRGVQDLPFREEFRAVPDSGHDELLLRRILENRMKPKEWA